jgi:SPASM domain peptide maturase of grasp-with-spasm system
MNQYIPVSNCIPVVGFQRAIMYDLVKMKFELIPNSLCVFLDLLNKQPIHLLLQSTIEDDREVLTEYVSFCTEKEYILEIPEQIPKDCFPKLNLEFESPSIISNICVNLNRKSPYIFNQLKELLFTTKCYNIQLICESNYELTNIINDISIISEIGLESIELIVPYVSNFNYTAIVEKHKNISFIFVYNSPEARFINTSFCGLQQVLFSEKPFHLTNKKSLEFFNVHISLFTESQKHNTYFNRKLFIGSNGELKNSPESLTIFGNINEIKQTDDILRIINSTEFQKYWYVNKDSIDVCKQCEFRHMCVDNRIPISNEILKNGIWKQSVTIIHL